MTARPSIRDVESLRGSMAEAAQAVYDAWEQDEEGNDAELGAGGICDGVAEAMAAVLAERLDGIECATEYSEVDTHASVVLAVAEGVYALDIPPSAYEAGFGFKWRKKPGVTLTGDDIALARLSPDPAEFWKYTSDGEPPPDGITP